MANVPLKHIKCGRLKNLDSNGAQGPDEIHGKILEKCATVA